MLGASRPKSTPSSRKYSLHTLEGLVMSTENQSHLLRSIWQVSTGLFVHKQILMVGDIFEWSGLLVVNRSISAVLEMLVDSPELYSRSTP